MPPLLPADKLAILRTVSDAEARGVSLRQACAEIRVPVSSVSRWRREFAEGGLDALHAKKSTGRKPVAEWSDEQVAIARWHRLTKRSLPIAIHFYMCDPRADQEIIIALRRLEERALESGRPVDWPLSVRRAFEISDDEAARFRGKKAAQNTEMVTRRGMVWIDDQGTTHHLLPGELWELDDYSCNQPFSYLNPLTGEIDLGRQILAGMDLVSGGWLGFDLIGRPRDAYRGEDIVRYIARLIRAHGVPRFLRLERGSWESDAVHGIDDGAGGTWGALDDIMHIEHVFKSKGKGLLEGSFNPLQNWLAHAGRDVGRITGEFEETNKAWRQARNAASRPDPRALGFWEQGQCASAHEEAAKIMNSRPRQRKALGEMVSPDDLRARMGWHTTPLRDADAWRLLPCKQRRVVRGGHVIVNPGGGWPELSFVLNGIDGLSLETGHAVLIACDPADPAAGAYIANADKSPRNRQGWSIGQVLCAAAPLAELAPQIDLSGRRHRTIDLRRQAAAAAATEFRAIRAAGPGAREISIADGRGLAAQAGSLPPLARAATPAQAPAPAGRAGLAPAAPAPDPGQPRATAPPGNDRLAALRALEAAGLDF
jgi:hypothetical protein